MRPLFHSCRLNGISRTELFSLPPLRAEKRGGEWHCLVPEGAVLASLSARPEVACRFIEFLLVLRKLPSFHWVVILAIICYVRCINAMKLQILISKLNFY